MFKFGQMGFNSIRETLKARVKQPSYRTHGSQEGGVCIHQALRIPGFSEAPGTLIFQNL